MPAAGRRHAVRLLFTYRKLQPDGPDATRRSIKLPFVPGLPRMNATGRAGSEDRDERGADLSESGITFVTGGSAYGAGYTAVTFGGRQAFALRRRR